MRKYYYSFSIISFLVIAAILYGFKLAGSPFNQKMLSQDSSRLSNMSIIKSSIDQYYQENKMLPKTLEDLVPKFSAKLPIDPGTQKPFDYKLVTASSYSLCATFALDTKDPKSTYYQNDSYLSYDDTSNKHSKGYDCLDYKIPSYLSNPYISPTPRKTESSSITVFGTVDSIAESDTNPRIIVSDNKIMKIFSLNNTEIIDQQGNKVTLSAFKSGDKVIVDANPVSGNYTNLSASRLQNLSR